MLCWGFPRCMRIRMDADTSMFRTSAGCRSQLPRPLARMEGDLMTFEMHQENGCMSHSPSRTAECQQMSDAAAERRVCALPDRSGRPMSGTAPVPRSEGKPLAPPDENLTPVQCDGRGLYSQPPMQVSNRLLLSWSGPPPGLSAAA